MKEFDLLGKEILGYIATEFLGTGTFGTVYKVVKKNASGSYVRALKHITIPSEKQYEKVLKSMGGDGNRANNYFASSLEGIVREIKVLNELSEDGATHIVKYYENHIDSVDNPRSYDVYILMEFLTTLEEHIQNNSFRVRDVVELGLDILEGLKACHRNGVIHRDIKEDNIFYSEKGGYKIGDFGVAKLLNYTETEGAVKGTPNYIAPEIIVNKASYNKSVDLYSLGIVLYRLLNYNRNPFLPSYPKPYTSQDEEAAYTKRISGLLPEMPCFGGNEIGKVIIKAISGVETRYQDAESFYNALKVALNNTTEDILEQSIKGEAIQGIKNSSASAKATGYGATLNEALFTENIARATNVTFGNEQEQCGHDEINKRLFSTIDEGKDEKKYGNLKNMRIVDGSKEEEKPVQPAFYKKYFTKEWAMRGVACIIAVSIAMYLYFSGSPTTILKEYIGAIAAGDYGRAYQCLEVKNYPTLGSASYLRFVEYARNSKENNIYKLSQNEIGAVELTKGAENSGIQEYEANITVKRNGSDEKLKYTMFVEKIKTGPLGIFTGYRIAGKGVYDIPKINCLTSTEQLSIDNVKLDKEGERLDLSKPIFYGWHAVECKGKFYEPVKDRANFDKASGMLKLDSKKFKLNNVANEALYEASKEFTGLFLPATLTDNGFKQCRAATDEKTLNEMYSSFRDGFKQVGVSQIKITDGKILTSFAGENGNIHCQYQYFGVYEKDAISEKQCAGTINFEYVCEDGHLIVAKVNDYSIHLKD